MVVAHRRKTIAAKKRGAFAIAVSTRNKAVPVTRREGHRILDAQARKYLNMSGAEFATKYRAGEIPDPDRSDVIRVAMLLPYADR